jgi:phosphate-selective porin OprO/OprP
MRERALVAGAIGAALAVIAPAALASPETDALDQRVRVLERQLEMQKEESENKAKDATTASAGDKGFGIKSGDFEVRLRGFAQADARFYAGDPAAQGFKDTFLLRRAEPSIEGSVGRLIAFKIVAQLAPNSAGASSVVDAYADVRFDPAATVRLGRFKTPVGLENLESSSQLEFIERGFTNELVPGRDYGVQLQGIVAGTTVNYALGVFNGTADGRDAAATDVDNRKEFAGRLFFEPCRNDTGLLQGFGFGLGASYGTKLPVAPATAAAVTGAGALTVSATGDTGNTQLPSYRSPGQQVFFSFISTGTGATPAAASATIVQANGTFVHYAPQAYYYRHAFGLQLEYVESEHHIVRGANTAKLDNRAHQALASFVLTGEDASYNGVRPAHPFQAGAGWGAFELVARHGVLRVDPAAFGPTLATSFADPSKSAARAVDYGAGLNWYLTANARLGVDFDLTRFNGGNGTFAAVTNRPIERAIFSRLQYAF